MVGRMLSDQPASDVASNPVVAVDSRNLTHVGEQRDGGLTDLLDERGELGGVDVAAWADCHSSDTAPVAQGLVCRLRVIVASNEIGDAMSSSNQIATKVEDELMSASNAAVSGRIEWIVDDRDNENVHKVP